MSTSRPYRAVSHSDRLLSAPLSSVPQAWVFPTGDPEAAVLLDAYGAAPARLARFYQEVADAEPHVVLTPEIGVRDAHGQSVRAYDLLTLAAEPGSVTTSPSLGVACLAEDGPDVVPLVVGRAVWPRSRFAAEEREQRFHHIVYGDEDYHVEWAHVVAVGSAFERRQLLAAAGLTLAELLQGLDLPLPEAARTLRQGPADSTLLRHLLEARLDADYLLCP